MKRDKDWTDVMRSALRDAELTPPEGGWERLRREIDAAAQAEASSPTPPRRPLWRIYGLRIAAAAAVVLLGVVAGDVLLRPKETLPAEIELASEVETDAIVRSLSDSGSVRDVLAEAVGLSDGYGASEARRERLAASVHAGAAKTSAAERSAEEHSLSGAKTLAARTAYDVDAQPAAGTRPENGTGTQPVKTGTRVAMRSVAVPAGSEDAAPQTGRSDAGTATDSSAASRGKSAAGAGSRRVESDSQKAASDLGAGRRSGRSTQAANERRSAGKRTTRAKAGSTANAFAEEPFVAVRPRHKTASFSVFAGGGISSGDNGSFGPQRMLQIDDKYLVGNGNSLAILRDNDYEESSFRHHQALSFGIAVRKELSYGLSLESGVNYTLLRSDVRMQYASEDVSQKLHFIGVPLRLNWQFLQRGRFSLYMGAGGMVEKCVSARFGSRTVDERGVQWSALAALGAQYRLGGPVGLYFEPEGSYYFNDTDLRTARTDSPLTLTLRLGVRLSF